MQNLPRRHPRTVELITALFWTLAFSATCTAEPLVRFQTVLGEFFIDLTPQNSPNTVTNFLNYVNRGDYDASFFHRSVPGFIVQGGGFAWPISATSVDSIPADPAIINEFNVSNVRGTVAMAKAAFDPNSATNQWFVNLADNGGILDGQNGGFTVFGTIDAVGMQVVDAMAALDQLERPPPFNELPVIDFTPGGMVQRDNLVLVTRAQQFTTVAAIGAAILPSSRAVAVGTSATAFATLLNSAQSAAASCRILPTTTAAGIFSYQATNPATNAVVGAPNPLLDIAAGGAVSLVFSFTPSQAFASTRVEFDFVCANAAQSISIPGVNTFDLSAATVAGADVIALAATLGGAGITDLPGSNGSGAFSVATINLGNAELVRVSANSGATELPVNMFVCATDATSGACLSPPALSVDVQLANNETSTFSIFVMGSGDVAFDPANNRAFVRFTTVAGELRGGTSVAIRTVAE